MLSISAPIKGTGHANYFLKLAREDYYLGGGEPPGKWIGAKQGEVTAEELRRLMLAEGLVQNGGTERRSAWDFTFSAPKSVSILWSQSNERERKEIERAQQEAVEAAFEFLSKNHGLTRRGKGGHLAEQVNLIGASFEHGTSRAQDPQLHTHVLVMNLAKREDDTWGTIETKPLYKAKMAAGAIYRAELASRLGYRTRRVKTYFELDGVSQDLIDEFSKRRAEILEQLDGSTSAVAASMVALKTRQVKGHVSRDILFDRWQSRGGELGYKHLKRVELKSDFNLAIEEAVETLTQSNSYFTELELVRRTAEVSLGQKVHDIPIGVKRYLESSSAIVCLGHSRFTTREVLKLERDVIADLQRIARKKGHFVRPAMEGRTLSNEQESALQHLTNSPGQLKIVSGMAGTGKSYLLDAARESWERSGLEVHGVALAGKAADGLSCSAGIKSQTIHGFLASDQTIDKNSVLVVDEAAMVDTRLFAKLVKRVKGGKLVLVGDAKQLQPIGLGGIFREIANLEGQVELKDIRRQREAWAVQSVKDLALGRAEKALEAYAERGLLSVSKTREKAQRQLIEDWKERGIEAPQDNLIIASTNKEVSALNKKAQKMRKEAGVLGTENIQGFSVGDRLMFTKNSKLYRVKNGELGFITAVLPSKKELTVRTDSGHSVKIPLKHYDHLQLGYAISSHKAQGVSVERSYVLVGGSMQDRELSYVQLSRSKQETKIYTDRLEAGDSLIRSMKLSREKKLAYEAHPRRKIN